MRKPTFSVNQQTSRRHKSRTLIALIAVLLLVLGAGGYYLYQKRDDRAGRTQQTTTRDSASKNEGGKKNDGSSSVKEEEKTTPSQYEATPSTSNSGLTGVINYKSIVGSNLVIRITIDQTLSSGTCSLSLANASGKKVTKSASIAPNPSSSSCQGFDIPTSELGGGTWQIVIDLTDNTGKTGIIRGEVTI